MKSSSLVLILSGCVLPGGKIPSVILGETGSTEPRDDTGVRVSDSTPGEVTQEEYDELVALVVTLQNQLDDVAATQEAQVEEVNELEERVEVLEAWEPETWTHTDTAPTGTPLVSFELDLKEGQILVWCSLRATSEGTMRVGIEATDGSSEAHSDTLGLAGDALYDPTKAYGFSVPESGTYTIWCDASTFYDVLEVHVFVLALPAFGTDRELP